MVVLRAGAQSRREFANRRWQDEEARDVFSHAMPQLLCALPVHVEEYVAATGERRFDGRSRRTVEVPINLGVLEKLSLFDHLAEFHRAFEEIMDPFDLA